MSDLNDYLEDRISWIEFWRRHNGFTGPMVCPCEDENCFASLPALEGT